MLKQRDDEDLHVHGLTQEAINDIDRLFPERAPNPKDTEREIWMKAGERRLVRYLIDQFRLAHNIKED